jgi:hypothetical protein
MIFKPITQMDLRTIERYLTLIIVHVVYVTSRFDFHLRHFQFLPFNFIKYFYYSAIKTTKSCKSKRRPDFNETHLLPIKNYVKNIFHS